MITKRVVLRGILGICICMFMMSLAINVWSSNFLFSKPANAVAQLSNKKICWGIKRVPNHQKPDVGSTNEKLIEQYNGICFGDTESNKIYLTFDAGYEAGYMNEILDTLMKNNVKACFFITGHYLNSQPDLVKRMIDEGHIVGNHTVNHKCMPEIDNEAIKKDVMDLHTAMFDKFGYEMKYIRPPKGEFSERTINYTNSLGYRTVMWSVAYDDWDEAKQGREEYGKKKVLDNLHNGAIILLHSNSKDNANILDDVIKEAQNMGYEFGTIEDI